jgi:hypothetical protein
MLPAPLKFLKLLPMKERIEKLKRQIEEDKMLMNSVCWQAQDAILNPNLSETHKDEVVDAAVETILKLGEDRQTYTAIIDAHYPQRRERRQSKQSQTIYRAK